MSQETQDKISKDLEAGIELLLDQMPDYVQDLVVEIASQAFVPKWQLIGGILFEAYNNGYLSAYTLDPGWKDGFKVSESECKFCHEKYMPVRIGQLFCCNDCGQGIPKVVEEPEPELEPVPDPPPKSTKKTKKKEGNKSVTTKHDLSKLANLAKPGVTGSSSVSSGGKKAVNPEAKKGWTDPDV